MQFFDNAVRYWIAPPLIKQKRSILIEASEQAASHGQQNGSGLPAYLHEFFMLPLLRGIENDSIRARQSQEKRRDGRPKYTGQTAHLFQLRREWPKRSRPQVIRDGRSPARSICGTWLNE
jgi:hypothetical protein